MHAVLYYLFRGWERRACEAAAPSHVAPPATLRYCQRLIMHALQDEDEELQPEARDGALAQHIFV